MDRRFFLQALGAVTLQQLLSACQQNNRNVLEVHSLQKTLPPQLIGKFRSKSQVSLQLTLQSSPQEIFSQLGKWHKEVQSETAADSNQGSTASTPSIERPSRLASLGDYWLTQAIQQDLIQPINVEKLSRWSALAPQWQQLVRRDRNGHPKPDGQVWGIPYRWGATLIAYRPDKFKKLGWEPQDWSDLWRPELQGRISLLNQPREVIGLTLKKLQKSYNDQNLETLSALPQALEQLNQQALFYDSTHYLEPLILEDTWAAVGWSSDILPTLAREPDLKAVVPTSGTALWADLWVQPHPQQTEAANQWMNFWWEEAIANNLSEFTAAVSPVRSQSPSEKSQSRLLVVDPDRYKRSEFLLPLPSTTLEQYQKLWQTLQTNR
ncbi:extracellular solute-binding protein [Acaryochloris sp. IP29b_bin.137]|uniref:extracellular solute-binding protein n=1 Tax=Acaryochloris sp. IP29b_bin.137 TaxID=2969217 RepID=UPI00261CBCA6|nr:extracellular solute-binding protein [Acaryochloris sp. IP29b_bin.137]